MMEADHRSPVPSPADIAKWLRNLINERTSRENAAKWASSWVEGKKSDGKESTELKIMEMLTIAHLKSSNGSYLFGPAEFIQWLETLLNNMPP